MSIVEQQAASLFFQGLLIEHLRGEYLLWGAYLLLWAVIPYRAGSGKYTAAYHHWSSSWGSALSLSFRPLHKIFFTHVIPILSIIHHHHLNVEDLRFFTPFFSFRKCLTSFAPESSLRDPLLSTSTYSCFFCYSHIYPGCGAGWIAGKWGEISFELEWAGTDWGRGEYIRSSSSSIMI